MAEIRIYGDPVLRKTAATVTSFDENLKGIIEEMKVAMYKEDGVGLAAPQIGHSIRVVTIDPTGEQDKPYIFINPEIFFSSSETEDSEEGCLSVPGIHIIVNRPKIVSIRAVDEHSTPFELTQVDGLFARAIQHEVDHLNGILFVDRASAVRRQLIAGKLRKLAKSHQ